MTLKSESCNGRGIRVHKGLREMGTHLWPEIDRETRIGLRDPFKACLIECFVSDAKGVKCPTR